MRLALPRPKSMGSMGGRRLHRPARALVYQKVRPVAVKCTCGRGKVLVVSDARRDESRGVAATHRGDERRRVMRGVSGGVRPSAVLGPGALGRAGRPEPMATAVRQFWQNGRPAGF